jgi:hypothetical protein
VKNLREKTKNFDAHDVPHTKQVKKFSSKKVIFFAERPLPPPPTLPLFGGLGGGGGGGGGFTLNSSVPAKRNYSKLQFELPVQKHQHKSHPAVGTLLAERRIAGSLWQMVAQHWQQQQQRVHVDAVGGSLVFRHTHSERLDNVEVVHNVLEVRWRGCQAFVEEH